ncbi:kinesin-like protein KIF21A isoform X2 [Frankliniella occidentalis]|uniref:Kinesin-like protein KIF21A isoform X2 n=1 Tax=Frankliniella occidentalis TaxID=133901 RepID=A0A9C6U9M3_FRAOC|nr:kinesin-like protein KIF21A isoform X2 [Frankliniella occidentalis]
MADEESTVRVAVRVRPQIAREVIDACRVCTSVTPGEPQVTLGSDKAFTYDYVFDIGQDQPSVYDTCVHDLVESSLDGYNATVLAYGQTGSGKTYTMGTGFDVELQADDVGIIPRAIHHLFNGISARTERARESGAPAPEFKIVCQFLELYNEEIIDLFNPSEHYCNKNKKAIKIHEYPEGGIYLVGVTTKAVQTPEEALQCLRLGALSRTTASTQMNSQSSRSHAIFTIYIKQERVVKIEGNEDFVNGGTETANECEMLTAKFHFVDLAGSERLKRTGATGERAREGISINCGLLALGNVISALGDKSKRALHVPYRDSKLTRLLQDSLGGNSRTVMIACVSPSDRDFMETLNTLKYANRARNIRNKVVLNQDKSSRTIAILRGEIQRLELELLEYKQGKRVLGEDGIETVNDMYHENTMLQSEINNLRTRVKAMQETIDTLTQKNTLLLAEKATGTWINSGSDSDVTEMVKHYIKEIEELRVKLLESEAICKQLRKQSQIRASLSPRAAMTGHSFDHGFGFETDTNGLIQEAKRDLKRDLDILATKGRPPCPATKDNDAGKEGNDGQLMEAPDLDSDDDGNDDSDSDTDSEEKASTQIKVELAELTSEIDIKQKLIEELELSQRRLNSMKQHYEEKLAQLQTRIRATQEERDKVLASIVGGHNNQQTDKAKKVKEEYERKLSNMQKEVTRLQSAKKEHDRLVRSQTQYETQLKTLRTDLADMKKTKVKLLNQMREESQRHKNTEARRNREIAQLKKDSRRHENQIRTLEAEKRQKEIVLKRKQEEVTMLRRLAKPGLSNKAAGRVGERHSKKSAFSPRVAKQKWQSVEKNINKVALNKRTVAAMERDMERLLNEREALSKTLDLKIRKRDSARIHKHEPIVVKELEDEIEDLQANIDYVQDNITEAQHSIMQLEESKDTFDSFDVTSLTMSMTDLEEAGYLIEKLYNMTVNQSYIAAQRELSVKELEARLNELEQSNHLQEQLLQHMCRNNELDILSSKLTASGSTNGSGGAVGGSSSSSAASTRSSSPVDNVNGNSKGTSSVSGAGPKIRRRTALPEDLLYPTPLGHSVSTSSVGSSSVASSMTTSMTSSVGLSSGPREAVLTSSDSLMPPPSAKSIQRIPSAPGSLRNMGMNLKPALTEVKASPVMQRKTYDRQDSTSPRINRRTIVLGPGNLIGKPGSMEQDLDKSPPNSPPTYRRLNSRDRDRDVNVFSRLTSSTMQSSDHQDHGTITPFPGRVSMKAPLVCTHVAEGHKSAVLSVAATDDLMFSSSKDLTVKVWDLHSGRETLTLTGHPKNVVAVKYDPNRRLIFSVSSAYIKVWDMRASACIKTLSSSGQSTNGSLSFTNTVRALQIPPGECMINDIALNQSGEVLYSAAGDRVGVWDLRTFTELAKLNGGHQAAVSCLAVGRVSPHEDVVITGSRDHYIKVFEVIDQNEGVLTPRVKLDPPHYDGVQSLAMSGGILFSGSRDSCIKKWDLSKPELIQSMNNAHKDWVLSLAFIPGGPLLLSGCRGGTLKLWNADMCTLLGELKAHSHAINSVTTNSTQIFTASSDNTIRFWRINSRFDSSPDVIEA